MKRGRNNVNERDKEDDGKKIKGGRKDKIEESRKKVEEEKEDMKEKKRKRRED